MPRENAEAKGRRMVTEGRLLITLVDAQRIEARCRGNGELYRVGFTPDGWACTCPALGKCSHIVALQLVTIRPGGARW